MNPADKRMSDLLDRWLASVELHLKYTTLDEAAYRQVQPWPTHERPARWILETAQQKVLQLKALHRQHAAVNDGSFAEGLELMAFLANLVGAQNIQRFIPLANPTLADPNKETAPAATPAKPAATAPEPVASAKPATAPPAEAPSAPKTTAKPAAAPPVLAISDEATRELPTVSAGNIPSLDATREMPRPKVNLKKEPTPPVAKKTPPKPVAKPPSSPAPNAAGIQEVIVADAVRLLKWGKEWHELADLIGRMAERPGPVEVRRILKTQRKAIEGRLSV